MKRKGSRKILNIFFHLALALELAVFQFAWPMAIARAEDAPTNTPVEEQTTSADNEDEASADAEALADKDNADEDKGDKTTETTKEEDNADVAEEKGDTADEDSTDLWKTCKLDDLFDKLTDDKDGCDECRKKTSCGDIEICLKAKIKIENDASVTNDVDTAANTGGNEINLEEPRPERVPADITEAGNNLADSAEIADVADAAEQLDPGIPATVETEKSILSENADQLLEEARQERDQESNGSTVDAAAANTNDAPENKSSETTTGDATAAANIVNEVNTNIIGENGEEIVQNIYGDYTGDINLLDTFNALLENAENTNDSNESAFGALEISIENEADVENDVETSANTGQNEIDNENENGTSAITTGDAIAAANVVNIVNNNIIGNNFLFAVINIFGNWVGDLIVPGEGLLTAPQSGQPENFIVDVENDANIENNLETSASTGGNAIESEDGSASIQTGEAYADNVVTNQVGTTVVANNWFFLAVNNMGNWVGNVLNWNGETGGYDTVFSFDFDEADGSQGDLANWYTKIFISNEADIENNVTTTATTGENEIESEGGAAKVTTGNAYAFSKIMNLVNNNFIGNNWMFAVVNIFGTWRGDVEFAYPDLSVSLAGNVEKVKKGESYSYNIAVKNNGHADGNNVQIVLATPESISFQNSQERGLWNIPELKAGEEKIFKVDMMVEDNLPSEAKSIESQVAVKTDTKEVELENNASSSRIEIYDSSVAVDSDHDSVDSEAADQKVSALFVTRSISKKKIEVGQITEHTIVAENTGDATLVDVIVRDKVTNKKGDAGEYSWKVDKLDPGKKMAVTYKMLVNPGAPSGQYKNKAIAWGYDEDDKEVRSNEAGTRVDVSNFPVENEEYYTYYSYYYGSAPVGVSGDGVGILEFAEAAEIPVEERVLGAWTRSDICQTLSWWEWLFAAIIYLTIVHWSLLRQKRKVVEMGEGLIEKK